MPGAADAQNQGVHRRQRGPSLGLQVCGGLAELHPGSGAGCYAGKAYAPDEIQKKSICINGDIGEVLSQLA